MNLSVFGHRPPAPGAVNAAPAKFGAQTRWTPRLGDIFPDFSIRHGDGDFHFHEWAEGAWVYFFSHPSACTPVCTTEVADVAAHTHELRARGAKALNISTDPPALQKLWLAEIEQLFEVNIDFPLLSDPTGAVAKMCDMVHPNEDTLLCVRKGFIIDPSLRIRMIIEYPLNVGRDFAEVLRVIDALRSTEHTDLVAPGGWMPGDPLLLAPYIDAEAASETFGARLRTLNAYLRLVMPGQSR